MSCDSAFQVCKKCLMISTRPRLTFNEEGVCAACLWHETKQNGEIDWSSRKNDLMALVERAKARSGNNFDVLCPSSGGKDSTYVAHKLRELGLKPLTVTIHPALPFELENINLEEHIKRGYDNIRVSPNYEASRKIAKKTFIEMGQPLFGWMIVVQAALFRVATLFDVPFVMYGEEGESEYGGTSKYQNQINFSKEEKVKTYLSGVNFKKIAAELGLSEKDTYWWDFPSDEAIEKLDPIVTFWSYFEDWNSEKHLEFAKEHMGIQGRETRSIGSYGKYSQNDSKLYDLHVYLMFLKFGFGRCTQDVCIDIRTGSLTREQGLELINKYDGEYPEPYIQDYLEYFDMTQEEFDATIDTWANKDLLEKVNGRWVKKFTLA